MNDSKKASGARQRTEGDNRNSTPAKLQTKVYHNSEALDYNSAATRWKYDMCFHCGYYAEVGDDTRCRKFNCFVDQDARACPDFHDKYHHVCSKCGTGFLTLQEAESDGAEVQMGVSACICWHCR